jgi:hypothetical protein
MLCWLPEHPSKKTSQLLRKSAKMCFSAVETRTTVQAFQHFYYINNNFNGEDEIDCMLKKRLKKKTWCNNITVLTKT